MAHAEPIADLETAWDLATARGYLDPVKVEADGTVASMTEALDRLLERYPYLVDGDLDEPSSDGERPRGSGGSPVTRRKLRTPDDAALASRFLALQRRRRH